jgi:FkbM family methyltransferase
VILNRVRRLVDYLERPGLLRARRGGVRVDFVEELLRLRDTFALEPRTVVDVGANRGEFVRAVRFACPAASVIAFEPIPHLADRIRRDFHGQPVEVHAVALDDSEGTGDFHVLGSDDLSSLLPPAAALRHRTAEGHEAHVIQVPVRRLDDVCHLGAQHEPVLLKVDVQGGELRVLRGAERLLARVACLKLECDFEHLYEGQPSFAQVLSFLAERGFVRFLQVGTHFSRNRIDWCDLLLFRS